MKKRIVSCLAAFLVVAGIALACDKCDKRIIEEAENKLLKIVPNLETTECAYEALMRIAITKGYIPRHVCYRMTEEEYNKARKIALEKKTLAALKAMHKAEIEG